MEQEVRVILMALAECESLPQQLREHAESARQLLKVRKLKMVLAVPAEVNGEAWAEWLDYRAEHRFPAYKPRSAAKMLHWLATFDHEAQRAIIDYSMRNRYQGLFEQRASHDNHNGASRYDRLGRQFESKAASLFPVESTATDVRLALPRPIRDRA